MSKSNDALTAFLNSWEKLKNQRPEENMYFLDYGPKLSYELMDELFGRWKLVIGSLEEKGYWGTSPEATVADVPLSNLIGELSSSVASGRNHGVQSMLSNRFLEIANSIQQQLATLTARQRAVNKEAAKIIVERGTNELETIVAASKSARDVLAVASEVAEGNRTIQEAASSARDAGVIVEETTNRLADLSVAAQKSVESAAAYEKEISQIHSEIAVQKRAAEERETSLRERVEQADAHIRETDAAALAALSSVKEALRKVRDQGLAKSFQDRSTNLQSERRLWTICFVGSAVLLLVIAMVFTIELSAMTYEAAAVLFLRKIGLVAPVVWLGWYSARQVGRISRVQEDYEYKAASALAFQAYKEEARLGGDPEMEKKLLDHAIRTFGDNPVRLYENHTSEPVTPLQAAIKELPPEKIAAILAAVGEQSLKAKFWPFGK
jgi:hypothetical protein